MKKRTVQCSGGPRTNSSNLTPFSRLISAGAFRALALFGLLVLLAPASRAGITIQMQINRNCQEGGPAYYLIFPSLVTNTPVPPDTAYFIWSSTSSQDSGNFADLLPDGSNPGGDGFYGDNFPAFLADMTNLWTLMVTNDTSTNFYSFRFSSFASNLMPFVQVTFPANGSTNVTNQPTFTWNGTTNLTSLGVQTTDPGDVFVENASLAPTATNWPSPKPLYYGGTFNFFFNYGEDTSATIVASTPTNGLGQSLPGWGSTSSVSDYADTTFTTFNPFGTNPIPLGAALNYTNLTWVTSGDSNWFGEAPVSEDGLAAAQSGILQDNQSSVLQTTVTGPGLLTFWWQTTGQPDNFDLEFADNGSDVADIGSQTSWQQYSHPVAAGSHTVTWTATSGTGSSPTDAGFVDIVTYSNFTAPSPGQWTATGVMSNAIYLQSTTLLPNGKVLVAGGSDNNNNPTANVELYNPATGLWTSTNPLPDERFYHTATLLTNGYVLVTGGVSNFSGPGLSRTALLYNPTNSTWTATGPMHYPRYGHTATLLGDGTVLVAGGIGTNLPNTNLAEILPAEVYNPITSNWTVKGSLSQGRYNFTATLLPNGQVLIAGGEITNNFLVTGECELYDPGSGTFSATMSMLDTVGNHTATLLPDGKVLVAGGDTSFGSFGGFSYDTLTDAEIYDPNSQTWSMTGSMKAPHDFHTATLLTNGLVLEAGTAYYNTPSDSAELYDPVFQVWTTAAAMNFPRNNLNALLLPNGQVLAVGGLQATAELYNSIVLPTITISNMVRLGSGAFQFNWTNFPGSSNDVLYSTNVATPFTNWTVLNGSSEISSGHFQFTDSQATNSPRRFYRVRSP